MGMKAETTTNLFNSDVVLKDTSFSEKLWPKDIILWTFHLAKIKKQCVIL